ncbi:MAG: hypothetical protein EOO62_14770 [Hymenobacter sp.]|nr:MAG: hypothetical protein EOO62_14770 [Hymenobacter sp.]
MKPLNQPERRTRLWQFSLLYVLALLVPLGASYYLFSNNSLADENSRLKKELDRTHQEQSRLVTQFDTLSRFLVRIDGADQQILANPNELVRGKLDVAIKDNLNSIAVGLSQLRLDSAQMQVPAHRLLARNVLRDFDLFRSNRSTIELLRKEAGLSGAAVASSNRLQQQLDQSQQRVIMLETALAQLRASANNNSGGGGGGAAVAIQPPPVGAGVKLQIELLRDQVSFAEADCLRQRALDHKSRSKERKQLLQQSRTAFIHILQNPATNDMKASIEKTLEPINIELGRPPKFFGLLGGD